MKNIFVLIKGHSSTICFYSCFNSLDDFASIFIILVFERSFNIISLLNFGGRFEGVDQG